jgi:hypothetical protein
MYQFESSPFSNVGSGLSGQGQINPFQNAGMGYQSALGQQRYGMASAQSALPFQTPQSPFQVSQGGLQSQYSGLSGSQTPYLSPEEFAGSLGGRYPELRSTIGTVDPIFITELSRCGRGLQDVAEQLEGKDQDAMRKGLFAATAHLFYAFGLLASKGIFISGDLPGKIRAEVGGPANASREFGRQLDRFVEKLATGRGVMEELSRLVERGTACYTEITKGIETGGTTETAEQQTRKKIA